MSQNFKPKLFVASSSESLSIANAVNVRLAKIAECTVWDQGIFIASRNTLESILSELLKSDFGVFIMSPDDIGEMRSEKKSTVRDNVIFELGMFVGRLGIERCFMLIPERTPTLHLPTDLAGINFITYEIGRSDGNLVSAVAPACAQIVEAMSAHSNDHSMSRLDLGGVWRAVFIERVGKTKTIVWDDLYVKQNGRKVSGYYQNADPERDRFYFTGDVAKDTISGFYHISENVHTGAGTFQLRADQTAEWLEGFCTWINYPEGSIGHSKHIWFRPGSDMAEKYKEKAEAILGASKPNPRRSAGNRGDHK